MTITHAIIKQKYEESLEKRQARKSDLQDAGQKLVNSYRESLSLPADMWRDSNGVPRHYVSTGFINERGMFQQASVSSFDIDENLTLNFIISTMISETTGGNFETAEVFISIYKEVGAYYMRVGEKTPSLKIVTLNAADAFDRVNDSIKKAVLSCFEDQRLDW